MDIGFWTATLTVQAALGSDYRVYSLFGATHICELLICVLACAVMAIVYRRSDERRRHRILVAISVIMLADEAFKHIFTIATGQWLPNYLPLHLCSINIFTCVICTFCNSDRVKEFSYSVALPGALLALASPSWFSVPILNAMHLHSYLIHVLLAMYPILLLAGGFKPNFRRNLFSLVILVAVSIPIHFVNDLLGTNFMFLNGSSSNPITVLLAKVFGEKLYLAGFPILLVAIWSLMYLPFGLFKKRVATPQAKC